MFGLVGVHYRRISILIFNSGSRTERVLGPETMKKTWALAILRNVFETTGGLKCGLLGTGTIQI